ncbi:HEAT repeat domain-containing protein [Natrialbaceae archaeon A-gly3]
MPGNGDPASGGIAVTVGGTHLPSLLARLEADDPDTVREAVESVEDAVTDDPGACVPTVPKLRGLLERDAIDFRDTVAYCLAELAAQSPEDVAPSVETISRYTRTAPTTGRAQALRCLTHVAAERPGAVAAHLEAVLAVLEENPGDEGVVQWGIACLSELAADGYGDLEAARPALETALEDDRVAVRRNACLVIGHGQVSAVLDHLETVAADEPNPEVRKRAVWAIEQARDGD